MRPSKRRFSATSDGDTPAGRPRKRLVARSMGNFQGGAAPATMRPIQNIGRMSKGRWCERCGHLKQRCICGGVDAEG